MKNRNTGGGLIKSKEVEGLEDGSLESEVRSQEAGSWKPVKRSERTY
jgi:hypothetical protein